MYASKWVTKIVEKAEEVIRCTKTGSNRKNFLIAMAVMKLEKETPFSHPIVHGLDSDLHETTLVKTVATRYYDLRMFAESKKVTEQSQKSLNIRQRLNKIILFNNA